METIHDLIFLSDNLGENPDLLTGMSENDISRTRASIKKFFSPMGGVAMAIEALQAGEHPDDLKAKLTFLLNQLNRFDVDRLNAKGRKKKLPNQDAAAFQEVYKGELSELWEKLAGMLRPLVSVSGKFIWDGENVSVLMALAQSLLTKDRITGTYKAEAVYRMLCAHFGEDAAERPRIKASTASGFTETYTDHLTSFNDLFNDK